ncbi:MAG: alpha/beta fold hydrolase [Betaproteobacteria bacterium]
MRRSSMLTWMFAVAGVVPLAAGCASTAAPAAAVAPAAGERRVPTPAGELVVREAGRGRTPLVLWHALYADPSMFEPLIERLAPDYRLLIVAAPGHGPSGLPAGPLTSAASGAAVLAILDAYGIDRAAVVGCSWGGIAGIQAAAQAPQRIAAVAAFNTPFGPGSDDIGTQAIVWMTGWMGDTEFFGRRVAAGFFSPQTHKDKPQLVDKFIAVFPTRDEDKLQVAARAVLIERESLLPLLPKVRAPVLVVAGADDARYPAAEAEAAAKQMSSAKFVRVENSAHLTPLEHPEVSARLIRELMPPR